MLRVFSTIALPLLLPTAIYLCWLRLMHRTPQNGAADGPAVPWVWLAAAGALLLVVVLVVITVHFGTSQPGTYVPPHWDGGRVVPSHIEPGSSR